jgi:hypothetical protein
MILLLAFLFAFTFLDKVASISYSGEFVGMVADDPDCKIELKSFHCEILNDHEALRQEQDN